MTFAAPYVPPLRASITLAESKRTMTARSVKLAAAPSDNPVPASMLAPLGVASNCAVNEPFCVANAVFCHAVELVVHPGGGGCTTVTTEVPLFVSLVAVIVAEPAATPVTRPLALTVATAVLLLDQVTTRPVSGAPLRSLGVAVSCSVRPTCTLAGDGLTVTQATGTADTATTD